MLCRKRGKERNLESKPHETHWQIEKDGQLHEHEKHTQLIRTLACIMSTNLDDGDGGQVNDATWLIRKRVRRLFLILVVKDRTVSDNVEAALPEP